jgi:hypothetical protein
MIQEAFITGSLVTNPPSGSVTIFIDENQIPAVKYTDGQVIELISGSINYIYVSGSSGYSGFSGYSGQIGPQGTSINWIGDWDPAYEYVKYDGVTYSGSSYVSLINNNLGNEPDINPADWLVIASGQSGYSGFSGYSGLDGILATDGANTIRWNYSGSSAFGEPNDTFFITDSIDFYNLTQMSISVVDSHNLNVNDWLQALDEAIGVVGWKALLQIVDTTNAQLFGIYNVTVDAVVTDYYNLNLTKLQAIDADMVPGREYAISWVLSGTGISGFSGYSGYSSTVAGTSGYSGYSGTSGISGYSGYSATSGYSGYSGTSGYSGAAPVQLGVALSDESTALTASTSVPKVTLYAPKAMTLTTVYGCLTVPGTTTTTLDVWDGARSILSTTITIASGSYYSTNGVIGTNSGSIAQNDKLQFYVNGAGTSAAGAKIFLY